MINYEIYVIIIPTDRQKNLKVQIGILNKSSVEKPHKCDA